ncbi:MAG: acylneuraminate cytidylyltransferase family protein [Candidatus Omnitrophica bacterium]|nr:acylneuraminate cytidylyltransferase family protein [Candidatus Omnitrophota bacterium]MDE2223439.1 acylneuraminate cytidylyltransferase family protein [Candidatus Omnitrophota bacterium]
MYKKRKVLALIPARGGSKGLPGKNIKKLLGKPLVAWSIEQALGSKYVDRVVVSTDCGEVAAVARRYGADVPFMRPKALATDTASSMDVVEHALDFLRKQGHVFDYLLLIEPTSPLRRKNDFDEGIKRLIDQEGRVDSLVSLGEIHMEHPAYVKKITGGLLMPYVPGLKKVSRRQDLDKAYFPYGVIYLSKVPALLKARTFYQQRTIPYLIERWQNFEIDDIVDFFCIEAVMGKKLKEKGL